MTFSYQRLLEIIRKLPEDESEYILKHLLKMDKTHHNVVLNLDWQRIELAKTQAELLYQMSQLQEKQRLLDKKLGKDNGRIKELEMRLEKANEKILKLKGRLYHGTAIPSELGRTDMEDGTCSMGPSEINDGIGEQAQGEE